ncbi:inositol monophosphatase family protein [Oceanobacillus chungangensis]|uniref:inositol-phosphate phosphatase n=1 Tax=Oceanobacillus chungangensis TaxID=1229152 RepID=A0A3D8PPS0_9BACI|nr:inositol monophosphatase family protein [Oceanobacillus chungangensis]RDW17964.1 inositol monophosphatase [Oceanobacillus chungangensis]
MNTEERKAIYNQAKEWVLEAGKNIRAKIDDPLIIDTKSNPNDLVTTMDKETEAYFVGKINQIFPEHHIIGEEGYGDKLTSLDGTVWIIDPIDGTMNFVHQKRNFAISVGIYHDGIGEIGLIYDVMEDNLYHAKRTEGAYKNENKLAPLAQNVRFDEAIIGLNHYWLCENRLVDELVMQQFVRKIRGSRTYGSAALEFAYVAEGIINGYLTMSLAPWDIAAGIVIVNEVGGVTTDIDGATLDMLEKNSVLTCNQGLQQEIIQFIEKGRK